MTEQERVIQWRKGMIEKYPYLLPRNVFSGKVSEDYDYSYIIGEYCLPKGWFDLFLQMCEDIREPLERSGHLNDFMFMQVKEKYGSMRLYDNGATSEVHEILDKYEFLSTQVCSECGRPATKMTVGYICPYCDDCVKNSGEDIELADPIDIRTEYKRLRYLNGVKEELNVSVTDEWERYLERIGFVL